MSKAFKSQAVPLIFIEVCASAIKAKNFDRDTLRIMGRIDKWLHECWEPLKKLRVSDESAARIVSQITLKIQQRLSEFWADDRQEYTEVPSAMLAVAEDVFDRLPKNNKQRIKSWRFLIKALYDFLLLIDSELKDNEGQARGCEIADMVSAELK